MYKKAPKVKAFCKNISPKSKWIIGSKKEKVYILTN